jgi:hypothetical protein
MKREPHQQAFLVEGRPWKDAVIAYLEPRSPYRPWTIDNRAAVGDLLITVLSTTPRTVLCVERVSSPKNGTKPIEVVTERQLPALPTLPEVEQRARTKLPAQAGPIAGDDADRLLDILDPGWIGFAFGEESESVQGARILLASGGECTGCGQRLLVHRRTARSDVHVHTVEPSKIESSADWPAVLCSGCATDMIAGEYATFLDYRFSLNPACPRCSAAQTMAVQFGMMPAPVSALSSPPWVVDIGCTVTDDTPKWICGECDYRWQFEVDIRFEDGRGPRTGDRVRANLFNFDGRRLPNTFPPDVDDPLEIQVGRLIVEEVGSAWGSYTRHAIVRDDGAIREIEPDTIIAIRG